MADLAFLVDGALLWACPIPLCPMAKSGDRGKGAAASPKVCINEVLTDDELRAVLWKLQTEEERDGFGLVCKRWLRLQSSERRRLRARAGPAMLRRMAERFSGVVEMDLSQSTSRSFYPGLTDSDLSVVAARFWRLVSLDLKNCKGWGPVIYSPLSSLPVVLILVLPVWRSFLVISDFRWLICDDLFLPKPFFFVRYSDAFLDIYIWFVPSRCLFLFFSPGRRISFQLNNRWGKRMA